MTGARSLTAADDDDEKINLSHHRGTNPPSDRRRTALPWPGQSPRRPRPRSAPRTVCSIHLSRHCFEVVETTQTTKVNHSLHAVTRQQSEYLCYRPVCATMLCCHIDCSTIECSDKCLKIVLLKRKPIHTRSTG